MSLLILRLSRKSLIPIDIIHSYSTIETMERETGERVGGQEVQEMQRVVEAWQAQATEAQKVRQRVLITGPTSSILCIQPNARVGGGGGGSVDLSLHLSPRFSSSSLHATSNML